jgi:hypothetical protein
MEKETFWKGVSAGFLAGMAFAAALRYSPFEKFITGLSTLDGKMDRKLGKLEDKLGDKLEATGVRRPAAGEIVSSQGSDFGFRREQTEASTAGLTNGRSAVEERVDHIDLSQPQRRYPRSLDLGSAG